MDIQRTLQDFKARLDPLLTAYFDEKLREAEKEDALIAEALRHVKELTLAGGKRLRPIFMNYGFLAAGGHDRERILRASMAIEFIHMFLLIHDDIIDRDDMRHGVPTLHQRYAKWGERYLCLTQSEHFGNSIALIVGDMLFALGNDILFRSDFPPDRVFAALSKMQAIVSHTVVGQAKDIYLEYRGEASESEILSMYENKTARYTIEGPLHLGALLASDNEKLLEVFSAYARPLGIAFQIQDDILGIFGKSERTGKPVGSDIEEGKITLLVSSVLSRGEEGEKSELLRILQLKEKLRSQDIERFREIVVRSGALDYSKKLASKYIKESRTVLEQTKLSLQPEAREFLVSIADYLAHRDY